MQLDPIITRGEYNGKPTIELYKNDKDRYPFSFGYGKAALIQSALKKDPDFINRFLEENTIKQ